MQRVGCITLTQVPGLATRIISHRLINNFIICNTPTLGKRHSVTPRQFCFSMLSTRLRIWLVWNREHLKLTSNFHTQGKISHAWKYIYWPSITAGQYCIPLLQDNTIPAVSHCWTETIFTVQDKSPVQYVFFVPPVVQYIHRRVQKKKKKSQVDTFLLLQNI
jgi:hypothetical protein